MMCTKIPSKWNERTAKGRDLYAFEDIIGSSPTIKHTIEVAKHVSQFDFNILLTGESGTGKEMFAQAIHVQSRPNGPFVAVNCASIPRSLVETELFGYEGGAFTGAERNGHLGKIELSNQGTLFLDEIGDMPLEVQPALLRVLDDKRVMRVSGSRYIPVDFRLIAATNKNLCQMVEEKNFRADLYFRLSTLHLSIPPLRDRGEDILLLAQYFINQVCCKMQRQVPRLSAEACRVLMGYQWPGNVRQLENAMVYAVCMAGNEPISICHLPDQVRSGSLESKKGRQIHMKELEKMAIQDAMRHTGYNKIEAANLLGMSRTTLYRRLKEYGIALNTN